jgi:uncharacterized protein (DUF1330 family)
VTPASRRLTGIGRIDPAAVARLARSDLPRPLDVLNLIHLADARSYARYGLAVIPAMLTVGAKLRWMGTHTRALIGEPQAESLLIVRYPSHRRMLVMTLNPYYLVINRLRERGVRAFEAAFTHPHFERAPLHSERSLLMAHFNSPTTLDHVRAAIEPQVGPLVYASYEVASASYLRGRRPTDPNPLTYRNLACFAASAESDFDTPPLGDASLQLYQRASPRKLLAQAF